MMEADNVCRTCLQAFKVDEVVHLTVAESDTISLRQKLEACAPELTVGIVHDPVVCKVCAAAIVLSYQFRSSCLENEKILYRFIKQRKDNPYDLITTADLLNITRKDITEEHSYSFLKKFESRSSCSDTETESSLELKLPTTIQASLEGLVKQALADKAFTIEEGKVAMPKQTMKRKRGNKEIKKIVANEEKVIEAATSSTVSATIENVVKQINSKPGRRNIKHSLASENKQAITVTRSESNKLGKANSVNVTSEGPENKKPRKSPKKTTNNTEESSKSKIIEQKENSEKCKSPKKNRSKVDESSKSKVIEQRENSEQRKSPKKNTNKSDESSKPKVTEQKENSEKCESPKKNTNKSDESSKSKVIEQRENSEQRKSPKKNRNKGDESSKPKIIEQKENSEKCESPKKNRNKVDDSSKSKVVEQRENSEQRKSPKKNTKKGAESSKPKTIEQKENYVKVVNPNTLTYDKTTITPQRKILKKELHSGSSSNASAVQRIISSTPQKLHDLSIKKDISSPFVYIKENLSFNDTIENDLLEIKQQIIKNDAIQLQNSSDYRKNLKRYCCAKCSKTYTFKSHYDVHIKSHILKKIYSCPVCEKAFTQEKYLKAHTLLHGDSGLYQCDICRKYLSAATALKRHYRTHTGEKPYQCACCDKKFTQNIQLNVHMRTHTGFKPYTCNICNTSFSQKSHLMGHVRIHTGEKPYQCDECPKSFRKSYALQIHKHSHSIKPFQCKSCNILFKDAGVFERHVKKHLHTTVTIKTPIIRRVGQKSKRKILDELEQDVLDISKGVDLLAQRKSEGKQELYSCNACARNFTTAFSLRRHMKIHN